MPAFTIVPSNMIQGGILTNVSLGSNSIIFTFSDATTKQFLFSDIGTSQTEVFATALEANLSARKETLCSINPPIGGERDCDIRVDSTSASFFINGTWVQVWSV